MGGLAGLALANGYAHLGLNPCRHTLLAVIP